MSDKTDRQPETVNERPEGRKVPLKDALEGHHIMVDVDAITFGLLEDLQSQDARRTLDALAEVIVGGDLPHGTDRAGLRKLKPREIGPVAGAVCSTIELGNGK